MAGTEEKFDAAKVVTQKMIALLEAGTIPWRKTWVGCSTPATSMSTGKPYKGINRLLLSPAFSKYSSPFWGTYNCVGEHGGQVRKGEKSTLVVFWRFIDAIDKTTGLKKKIPILRYFNVFNAEQCDNLPDKFHPIRALNPMTTFEKIESCQRVITEYAGCPKIEHGGPRASYNPVSDTIRMPHGESFISKEDYYRALFHEMIHSTGHESRLDRDLTGGMESVSYSKEELIADLGAGFLMAETGIQCDAVDANIAAYLAGWLRVLKEPKNRNLIITAASAADKAVDHIRGRTEEKTPEDSVDADALVEV